MERCEWCLGSDIDRRYHDEEWGRPVHDDVKHFEFLSLEAMQCGLSWSIILKKRGILRECFSGFDFAKIARYNDRDVQRIMNTVGMIRSERKIRAIISNAAAFEQIREEFGSFDKYVWLFTNNRVHVYLGRVDTKPNDASFWQNFTHPALKRFDRRQPARTFLPCLCKIYARKSAHYFSVNTP